MGTYKTLEEAAAVRRKAEQCVYREFLDTYRKWQQRADDDPIWGKENPLSVQVFRDTTGEFHLFMLPVMG